MIDNEELIYKLISFIPKGKVLTYGYISYFLGIKSTRLIGQILHKNPLPEKNPCHRVVFADGSLSLNYAFGGIKKQKQLLKKEGIIFKKKINLKKYFWRPTKFLWYYFYLLKKFGEPGFWPWFNNGLKHTKEEIVIGAILTQNTRWQNVEKAVNNLRGTMNNSLEKIYQLGEKDINCLKKLIRPAGFYNQKAKRLWLLAKFIIENYQSLEKFFKLSIKKSRKILLEIKGIGKETADTILLYAGNKPIFLIDSYTKRFVDKYRLTFNLNYDHLQKCFMKNLPKDIKLFQDYHALIVKWGKTHS